MKNISLLETEVLIESTLSGKYLFNFLKQLDSKKFKIRIIYIIVDNIEITIERIKYRVIKGGHEIPEIDVRRRYLRSLNNFWYLYKNLAGNWDIVLNSEYRFELISQGIGESYQILNDEIFSKFVNNLQHGS